jgi:rhodanese-related sulfurtransferase
MPVTTDILTRLEPIAALSDGRLQELGEMCNVERVSQGLNPFRMNVVQSEQLLYLLSGQLRLTHADGQTEIIEGGSEVTRHALAADRAEFPEALALTDVQILRVDADLLDIILTWDQLSSYEKSCREQSQTGKWMQTTGVFSADSLKNGIFRALPPSNVDMLFHRMERITVKAGDTIIRQGEGGDYYYLIELGSAEVIRNTISQPPQRVAVLEAGQAFGEEALASGNKRNADVVMLTDGALLRLGKQDFVELMKTPLLVRVSVEETKRKLQQGAQLLDVRTSAEYDQKHFPQAAHAPLQNIRNTMKHLDPHKEYITFCQTGRRASAAAFLMAQQGFRVSVFSVQ